jgi:hypothetical protein
MAAVALLPTGTAQALWKLMGAARVLGITVAQVLGTTAKLAILHQEEAVTVKACNLLTVCHS